jgi:hypothetical protein
VIRSHAIIRQSAHHAAEAADHALQAFRDGRIEQEPAFTDRMIGHIEEAMRGFEVKGVTWQAKTLTDRGPKSQESQYGADFAGVLSIDLADYRVRKGFLAQAKLVEPDQAFPSAEYDRLRQQVSQMLDTTPDSFVFLYSKTGIFVVPALAVLSTGRRNPHELYHRSLSRFFEEHFSCFIGDRRISAPTIEALQQLRQQLNVQQILYLEAQQ